MRHKFTDSTEHDHWQLMLSAQRCPFYRQSCIICMLMAAWTTAALQRIGRRTDATNTSITKHLSMCHGDACSVIIVMAPQDSRYLG